MAQAREAGGRGRGATVALWTGGFLGIVLLLLFLAVVVFTSTPWGQGQVREIVLAQFEAVVDGEVRIGSIGGNLLEGVVLNDVTITDASGRPFLDAERVSFRYSVPLLLQQRILLTDLRLENARVVLDMPPGETWNFTRIFASDPDAEPAEPRTEPGWGSWIELRDLRISGSSVTLRMPWEPSEELGPDARAEELRRALTRETRERVVEVAGGYQSVMEFRDLGADLPRLIAAHPDSAAVTLEVARLAVVALPFHAPGVRVEDLSGTMHIGDEAVVMEGVRVELPGSNFRADGRVAYDLDQGRFVLEADPLSLADLRVAYATLPTEVEGDARVALNLDEDGFRLRAEEIDFRVGEGRVGGELDVVLDDLVRIGHADLTLDRIPTRLVARALPDLELPVHGEVSGHVEAQGAEPGEAGGAGGGPRPVDLDAWFEFTDEEGGTSRVAASGGVTLAPELAFADMELQLEPVQLSLLRSQVGGLPPGGSLAGSVRLDGAPGGLLRVAADLRLDDPGGGVSRIVATGGVVAGEELAFRGVEVAVNPFQLRSLRGMAPAEVATGTVVGSSRLDGSLRSGLVFDAGLVHEKGSERSRIGVAGEVSAAGEGRVVAALDAHELSLATLGAFVPDVGLHGQASGGAQVTGTFSELRVEAVFELPAEAVLEAGGTLELGTDAPGYDLRMAVAELDLSALSTRVTESTRIEGRVEARGRGIAPARMNAVLSANLVDRGPTFPGSLRAEMAVQNAMLHVEALRWEGEGSVVEILGTFGLEASRRGDLAYRIAVDAIEASEALVAILPLTDPLAGSVEAVGVVRGNVERVDVEGTLELEELLAAGHSVGSGRATYSVAGLGGEETRATVEAKAGDLLVGRLSYDSLSVVGAYQGLGVGGPAPVHRATATIGVRQDAETRILADAGVEMADGDLELGIAVLDLDVGDAIYSLAGPATIRWTEAGLSFEGLRLEGLREGDSPEALVAVDGILPRTGMGAEETGLAGLAELNVRIEGLGIGHVMALVQGRDDVRGRLNLALPVAGTVDRPRFEGDLAVVDLHVDGHRLPDTRAHLVYGGSELTVAASMDEDGRPMATVEATLPVDLALVDAAPARLLPGPIQVEARLHDLRLDGFEALSEEVEDLEGRVTGEVTVTGTFDAPEPRGSLEVDAPSLTIVPLGVRFRDIAGSLSLADDVVTVDSLVAYSRGPLRIAGNIDLARPSEPALDLVLTARDSRIMSTEDVQLQADAELTIAGPFDGVVVEGDVRIREGRIRIPETRELAEPGPVDLRDPATFRRVDDAFVEARNTLVPPSVFARELTVDLTVFIDRGMWIRSTEANVELFSPPEVGPLTVRMEGLAARDLAVEGTISTDRGEYAFMGRRFDIARGTVIFTGETVDPLVRLTAEHEVQIPGREAFDIRIVVDGTLLDLETRLESTAQPPLSQTDLISFVVFGRGAGSLLQQSGSSLAGQGSSGGPLVGNVATRATQQFATVGIEALLKELEGETARALGLDVLHIQPSDTPAEVFTGRAADVLRGTEIEAGKYLTSRLFVSGNARPTFVHPGARVEYRTPGGYVWRAIWRPQFLPSAPTLATEEPDRASVLGLFLFREWRF